MNKCHHLYYGLKGKVPANMNTSIYLQYLISRIYVFTLSQNYHALFGHCVHKCIIFPNC